MFTRRPDNVVLYYLATPLFGVADLVFHAPLRVSAVLPEQTRLGYYALVFLLGVVCLRSPAATPWVGMGESAGNLLILLLGILLPIWNLPLAAAEGGPVAPGLSSWGVANALLAGGALILSFHGHQARAVGGVGRRRR